MCVCVCVLVDQVWRASSWHGAGEGRVVEPQQLVLLEEAEMAESASQDPLGSAFGAVLAFSMEEVRRLSPPTLRNLGAVLEKQLPGIPTLWTQLPLGLPDPFLSRAGSDSPVDLLGMRWLLIFRLLARSRCL